jgi:hypothetical protein
MEARHFLEQVVGKKRCGDFFVCLDFVGCDTKLFPGIEARQIQRDTVILPDISFAASPWILVDDDPILAMSWADSVVASPWNPAQ